jgi:hypothetical protein
MLADRIEELALDLLGTPSVRAPTEWRWRRKGSFRVMAQDSGRGRRGDFSDFETGTGGDALDLIAEVHGTDLRAAMQFAMSWLGQADPDRRHIERPAAPPVPKHPEKSDAWRNTWQRAGALAGTIGDAYLSARRASYDDIVREVVRFDPQCVRLAPETGVLERHPALITLLRDAMTGTPCGVQRIFLKPDGSDRLRDAKGKATLGRAHGAVVMLDPFDEPTTGLIVVEGFESAAAVRADGLRPIWATCGTSGLRSLPVLRGIEVLTIMADNDTAGREAAAACAMRWQQAGAEVRICTPGRDGADWNDVVKVLAA